MTCIVGIVHNGMVYIGGDSITSNGYTREITLRRKVFRVGEFLIGSCGSIRAANLIKHSLIVRPIEENETDEHYLVVAFTEALRSLLKTSGVMKIENNVERGAELLVGFRGQIYSIESDLQVDSYASGVTACGAGRDYVLGALLALHNLAPEERMLKSLEISAELCALVAPPFYVEKI